MTVNFKQIFKNTTRTLVFYSGLFSFCLGLIVMLGWHLQAIAFVRIFPSAIPMQYNTALAFFFLGLGYIAFSFNLKLWARACAFFAFSIGALTFLEYIFQIDLGIDQLFNKPFFEIKLDYTGRMAPNTSLCFMLTSVALWLLSAAKRVISKILIISILLSTSLILAIIALWGYLTGIEAAYEWGPFNPMSLHTSIAFIVLSAGMWIYVNSLAKTQ